MPGLAQPGSGPSPASTRMGPWAPGLMFTWVLEALAAPCPRTCKSGYPPTPNTTVSRTTQREGAIQGFRKTQRSRSHHASLPAESGCFQRTGLGGKHETEAADTTPGTVGVLSHMRALLGWKYIHLRSQPNTLRISEELWVHLYP